MTNSEVFFIEDQFLHHKLIDEISLGDLIRKPGWIRMSIHPTTTNKEIEFVCDSIKALAKNHKVWAKDYNYDKLTNEFIHKQFNLEYRTDRIKNWFIL